MIFFSTFHISFLISFRFNLNFTKKKKIVHLKCDDYVDYMPPGNKYISQRNFLTNKTEFLCASHCCLYWIFITLSILSNEWNDSLEYLEYWRNEDPFRQETYQEFCLRLWNYLWIVHVNCKEMERKRHKIQFSFFFQVPLTIKKVLIELASKFDALM